MNLSRSTRASLQLSANMIVILIVCIAVLGLGLGFIGNVFEKSTTFKDTINSQLESQIESMLAEGKLVAIPRTVVDAKRKYAEFGLGIINEFGEDVYFTINIQNNLFTPKQGEAEAFEGGEIHFNDPGTILNNRHVAKKILIKLPSNAQKGRYSYNLYVCYNPADPANAAPTCPGENNEYKYDTLKKLYVNVK